jgi:protein O-GlcNAc transferase
VAKNKAKRPKKLKPRKKGSKPQNVPEELKAMLSQALSNHQSGLMDQAILVYRQVLAVQPDFADANHLLGIALHHRGELEEAVGLIKKAIKSVPGRAAFHSNLGNALKDVGRIDEAVASFRKALVLDSEHANAHINLGNVLNQLGRYNESGPHLQKAIRLQPDSPEAHNNLGLMLHEGQHQLNEAVSSFNKALSLRPDFPEAHYNLGNVLSEQFCLDDAVVSFQKALSLRPGYTVAHINLGNAFKEQNKLEEAVRSYRKAIEIDPDKAELHSNLGSTLKEQGNLIGAVASFKKAIAIWPEYADAYYNLGNVIHEQGDVDGAFEQLDLALSHKPENTGWRIRQTILLPVIPASEEDIQCRRNKLGEAVKQLQEQGLSLEDPTSVGATNFYLTYHNLDNRTILQDIATLYMTACPKLAFKAEHCQSENREPKNRLRIGFLSSFFWEHTIGKLSRGMIEHFSHDQFEVIVFQFPGKRDHMTEAIEKAADKLVPLHKNLDKDWNKIAEQELDILFYPDIGMDPYTYFLSFARLAPVQVVSWGHPETIGSPNIDYFISSELIEFPGSAEQYKEQLALLSLLPTYYYRPETPELTYGRADYSLPEQGALYVCPQTLFKFHPTFDPLIGELLRRDLDGYLVLIDDGKGGCWNKLILERLGSVCPDVTGRVIFVPRMDKNKFMGLILIADAVLDVPTFSGGNSSMEAFAMGAPIVTWPGDFMRSRVTAGCYKQMGISELTASDGEEYVSLALKLAQDIDFRSRMQGEIKANSHKLFERKEVVRELEFFFVDAFKALQKV